MRFCMVIYIIIRERKVIPGFSDQKKRQKPKVLNFSDDIEKESSRKKTISSLKKEWKTVK